MKIQIFYSWGTQTKKVLKSGSIPFSLSFSTLSEQILYNLIYTQNAHHFHCCVMAQAHSIFFPSHYNRLTSRCFHDTIFKVS